MDNLKPIGQGQARKFLVKQRIEITFEMRETVVMRYGDLILSAFCPHCQLDVAMATPLSAASLLRTGERDIFRMIESNAIHYVENELVLVCMRSLDAFRNEVSE